jgi:hypothetical protein
MDSLITAAARALRQGDPLGATLVLRPLNTTPDGSGSRVRSFLARRASKISRPAYHSARLIPALRGPA